MRVIQTLWITTLRSRSGWNSRLFFLMKKHSMFLPRLIFPLFCRVYFLYPFQLLWRSGRSHFFLKTQALNRANQRQRTDKALSLIGLDHDMILLSIGMGIINIYWYRYHFRYSLTIRVFIYTTIDTFLLFGGNAKRL